MNILAIIPARFASTRFPAKALADIDGKSMIQRVYEQAKKCHSLSHVVIATDHSSIYDHVLTFGGEVVMTSDQHQSGTDRCCEAYKKMGGGFDFVVNIQGDEPFILPEQVSMLCLSLDTNTEIATLIKKIEEEEVLFNPNAPKVIINQKQEAMYFSRHPIPYVRHADRSQWLTQHIYYKHIGIYAYRTDILREITNLSPSTLELAESLEQLRWLENGYKIKVTVTPYDSFGIDTPQDLEKIKKIGNL